MRVICVVLFINVLFVGFGAASAQTLADIQSYDPITGLPDSPYIGQSVTIQGRVAIPHGVLAADLYFIQDGTGGIAVRSDQAQIGGGFYLGEFTGTVVSVDGELRLEEIFASGWVNGPSLIRPSEVALNELANGFDQVGSWVRASGVAIDVESSGFTLVSAPDSVRVSFLPFTGLTSSLVSEGGFVSVTGPARMANGELFISPGADFDVYSDPPQRPYVLIDDSTGSFPDLATALAYSVPGDTISLDPGYYHAFGIVVPTGITVRSSDGVKGSAIVDALGQGRIFDFVNGPDSSIEGLTLRGGLASSGGAVRVYFDAVGHPRFESCRFEDNRASSGGAVSSVYASPEFIDCDFVGNEASAGGALSLDVVSYKKKSITPAVMGLAGGNKTLSRPTFEGCLFEGNNASVGGAFQLNGFDAYVPFTDCRFVGNRAFTQGGVAVLTEGTSPVFVGCLFWGNVADSTGSLFLLQDVGHHSSVILDQCSVIANGRPDGILLAGPEPVMTITNSILAFNVSGTLLETSLPEFSLSCSNVYGNAGGDWVGHLAPFAADQKNFSQNPLFCDLTGGDFSLNAASPCLPGQHPNGETCGTIGVLGLGSCSTEPEAAGTLSLGSIGPTTIHPGETVGLELEVLDAALVRTMDTGVPPSISESTALGMVGSIALGADQVWRAGYEAGPLTGEATIVAFDPEAQSANSDTVVVRITEAPIIRSVGDIADDQGHQVRVRWRADLRDSLGHVDPVTHYVVWRRVDDPAAIAARVVLPWDRWRVVGKSDNSNAPLLAANGEIWEPVGPQVPAMMWEEYASVVPTLVNGTEAGVGLSVFFVSAHVANPQGFRSSYPDSGYSADNLAPLPPVGVAKVDVGGGVELVWQPNYEEDLRAYRIYRASISQFSPRQGLFMVETGTPSWSSDEGAGEFFRVTAIDHAGNESEAVLANATSAVGLFPTRGVALHQNIPNPFNPSTKLAFDMGQSGSVRLTIYDVSGRLVRTLVDRHLGEGHHEYRWDGRDGRGRRASAGVYLYRLRTPVGEVTRRMVMVE